MARKVITTVLDDIDGSEGAETVTFALDGVSYEIDLSEKNADALRADLAKYIEAGRRVSRSNTPRSSRPSKSNEDLGAIREWAKKNGIEVSERGRVAQTVKDAYYAAN